MRNMTSLPNASSCIHAGAPSDDCTVWVVRYDVKHDANRCRERVAAFVKSFEDHGETAPFLFILNILVPGTPVVSTVMYWALERENGDGGEEGSSEGKAGLHLKAFTDMLERLDTIRRIVFLVLAGSFAIYLPHGGLEVPLSTPEVEWPSAMGSLCAYISYSNEVCRMTRCIDQR